MSDRKICVIDDDTDLVRLFSDALKSSGFTVKGFDNPVDAINYLNVHHNEFSLIVTDWIMPEMSGREVIKLISQMDSNIGIIMISAFEFGHDELQEIPKEDFIEKPIHIAQFLDVIRQELSPVYEICVG